MSQDSTLPSWQQFLGVFQKIRHDDELDRLFGALLTYEERSAIAHRVEIIAALLTGKESQRDLAARLQISIATVTRGSNMLKTLPEADRAFLKEILTKPER